MRDCFESTLTLSLIAGRLVITVAIDPTTNLKNATLSGTNRVICCSGICRYTDLTIDKALVGYRLLFSAPPLVRLVSPLFDVVGPRYLRMSQQPVAYAEGEPLVVQPRVDVLDIYRRPISGHWLTVVAAIRGGTGAAGGILQGTTSLFTNESTVVYTDLRVDRYGSGYVLEFSCAWFELEMSQPFDVDFAARPNVCSANEGKCSRP